MTIIKRGVLFLKKDTNSNTKESHRNVDLHAQVSIMLNSVGIVSCKGAHSIISSSTEA